MRHDNKPVDSTVQSQLSVNLAQILVPAIDFNEQHFEPRSSIGIVLGSKIGGTVELIGAQLVNVNCITLVAGQCPGILMVTFHPVLGFESHRSQ